MTDIFFSYSSADRERVRPVRDALVAQGFEVFWDQEVPTGLDWDSWIRQHLAKCKCAMAFWSAASVASDNVRHEAMVAKQQGKLISVLLEPLTIQQFPMGLYAQQAANLAGWDGDTNHNEWRKFRREFEAKLTPGWVRQHIDELEAELVAERARREGVERRDKTLQTQIAKEAETQLGLQRERDSALDEIAALTGTVEEITRARSEAQARETDTLQQVAALRATVDEVTRARSDAEQRLSKLRQTKAKEIVRSISPFVIAAAVATVGIWTYQLVWPAPQPVPAAPQPVPAVLEGTFISESTVRAEREQGAIREEQLRQAAADTQAKLEAAEGEKQRLKDEAQRQTKAAAEVEAKLQAAQTEQQRQAKAVTEAQTKLQAAQAELQTQAKAAKDADDKRKAAEAEQQQLKLEVQRLTKAATKQVALPQATSTVMAPSFESRPNMEAGYDRMPAGSDRVSRVEACQERCIQSGTCQTFTFNKSSSLCYLYDLSVSFRSNPNFDSGVRNPAGLPANQPASTVATGPFTRRPNEQASGYASGYASETAPSIGECERRCMQSAGCRVFTYNKINSYCSLYTRADFIPNADFDSGVRN